MLQATETALSLAVREEIGAVMSDRRPAYVAGADGAVRFANAAGILSAGAATFLDIAGRPLPLDPAVARHVARFAAHAEAGRRSTELLRYRAGLKTELVQVTLIALGDAGGERLVLVLLAEPLRGPQATDFAASLRLLREPGLLLAAFDERGDVSAAVGDYAILQHTQDEVEDFVAATDAAPVRRAVVGTNERVRVTIVAVGATDLRILAVERDDGAEDGAASVPAEPDPTVFGGAATELTVGDEASAVDAASAEDAAADILAALAPADPHEPPAPPYPGFDASDTERAIELVAEAGQSGEAPAVGDGAKNQEEVEASANDAAMPADHTSDGAPEPSSGEASDTVASATLVMAQDLPEAGTLEAPETETRHAEGHAAEAPGTDIPPAEKPETEAGSSDVEAPSFAFAATPRPRRIVWQTDAAGQLVFLSADFAAALGDGVAPRPGESWAEAAARLGADAADYVAAAFARQAQFAGLVLEWPVAGHPLSVPVELTGLPVFGPARRFDGFRGFGLVRTGDAKALRDPVRTLAETVREEPEREERAREEIGREEVGREPALDTGSAALAEDATPTADGEASMGPAPNSDAATWGTPDADAPTDEAPDGDVGASTSAPSASAASDEIEAEAPDASEGEHGSPDIAAKAETQTVEPVEELRHAPAEPSNEPAAPQPVADAGSHPDREPDDSSRGEPDDRTVVEHNVASDAAALETTPDGAPDAGEANASATTVAAQDELTDPAPAVAARPGGRPNLSIVENETQADSAKAEAPSTVPSPADTREPNAAPPLADAPLPADPQARGTESGRVVPVPAKADARVVTLASALRRPTDGRLTPPERIAFRQIAQALGARLEGDEPSRKSRPEPDAPPGAGGSPAARSVEERNPPSLGGGAVLADAPSVADVGIVGETVPSSDDRAEPASAALRGPAEDAPVAMDVVWADWVAAQDAATLKAVAETPAPIAEPIEAATPSPEPEPEPEEALAGVATDRSMPAAQAEAEPATARQPDTDTPPITDDRAAPSAPAEAVASARPARARAVSSFPADEADAKPRLGLADPVVVSDAAERILARLPIGAAVVKDETILFVNPAFLRLLGYATADELQQAGGLGALFAGPHAGRNFETGADAKPIPAVTKDGSVVPVTARIVVIPWGAGSALLLTLDRAQRALESETISGRAALDALGAARERADELEAVIDTATDGVLMLDGDGRVVSANRASEALFGQDRSEMTGRPFLALLAPESHRSAQDYLDGLSRNGVASVLNDGREVIGQVRPDGLIPLFMTIGRISSGRSSRFCAVLRDITQWKKSEEELTAARRRAEEASVHKSEFLAKISHEIRTPLNAVIGFSEVMLDERFGPIGNERYKDYLRDIRTSGAHIMSLINDLLDLSKVEAGKMDLKFEAVALADLLGECVAMMQPQANRERIIIRASLPISVPAVVADPRSIRQIVLNLLSNAVKFTPAGGQVIVSTALEDTGEVVVRVRDTGYGMTEKEIQTALEPFRQLHTARTRAGGTGLGLPLTKALVEANRAAFRIDSTVNQGTLVSVTFPVTRVLAG